MAWPLFWMPLPPPLLIYSFPPLLTPLSFRPSPRLDYAQDGPQQGKTVLPAKGMGHHHFPVLEISGRCWDRKGRSVCMQQSLDHEAGKLDLPLFLLLKAV